MKLTKLTKKDLKARGKEVNELIARWQSGQMSPEEASELVRDAIRRTQQRDLQIEIATAEAAEPGIFTRTATEKGRERIGAAGRFTESMLKKMPRPVKGWSSRIYDPARKGFWVRIKHDGTVAFGWNLGEQFGAIGHLGKDHSLESAIDVWHDKCRIERAGGDPNADKKPMDISTVGDLVIYIEQKKLATAKRSTRKMYRLAFAPLCKKLGKKMLASVDEDDLLAIRNQIADVDGNGRAKHPAMANQFIRVVRAAFNMAIDAKKRTGLTENPCDGIKLFPEDPRQMFLTPEQVAAMFDALREIEADTPGSANIIRLMAITGARGDEVRCMRWEHLTLADDASSWWTKPSHHTKQSKLENFPLHASAIAVLRSIPRTSDWVFPSKKSASGHQESTRKPWAKVRRSIGVKGLRPHDLRHTFISLIANAGGDLYTAGKLAGHTQMKTTQRYAHLFDKTTRAAQDRALSLVPNLPDESP